MNFLTELWERWKTIPAPVPTDSPSQAPLAPPALKQEQFADHQAEVQQRDQRITSLYRQVVATNNRNVTRHYGTCVVDETLPTVYFDAKNLTQADLDELTALKTGVVVMKDKP